MIQKYLDHTVLKATATETEIKKLCDEALKYNFVAICIPPCYIKTAKGFLKDSDVKIATVIGFPLGNQT